MNTMKGVNCMTLQELRFNIAKSHKNSYKTYPDASNVEEYCMKKSNWLYQANRTDSKYNISIKTSGERYEYPCEKFKELESKYFREIRS